MDYVKELEKLGFEGFFVFTKNARPILLRSYSDTLPPITDKTSHEIAALISSMIKIAEQLSQHLGLLRDVALHTFRLFIDYWDDIIFVLVFNERHYLEYRTSELLLLMKGTISLVKEIFHVVISEAQNFGSQDLLTLPELAEQERFQPILETVDRVLHESYFKMIESLNLTPTPGLRATPNLKISDLIKPPKKLS